MWQQICLSLQIYTLPSLLSKKEESKCLYSCWFCIASIHLHHLTKQNHFVHFFSAFLNEAGLNFVKQCIKLIETRGIPLNISIWGKMLFCPGNFYNIRYFCAKASPHRGCTGLEESTPRCSGWWQLYLVRIAILFFQRRSFFFFNIAIMCTVFFF